MKNTCYKLSNFFDKISKHYNLQDIIFIGFGNIYRGDDGFGIRITEELKKIISQNVYNENDLLEEEILKIIRGERNKLIIFFDVSNFSKIPGKIKIFEEKDIEYPKTDSHKIPLKLYMRLLQKNDNLSYLIGVQPKYLGDTLEKPIISKEIEESIDLILGSIHKILLVKK